MVDVLEGEFQLVTSEPEGERRRVTTGGQVENTQEALVKLKKYLQSHGLDKDTVLDD